MTAVPHTRTGKYVPRHAPPPARRIPPEGFLVVIYGGAVAVLALWWHHTPSVVGLDGWLTGAGRITGLLAGYACAVLLALMARVPVLDRVVGTDRLARWHATGGRYTVFLALAHTALIIWGSSITARTNVFDQTTTLVFQYQDVLWGTIGLLLLVGVGVVSARAARRRMSYETWHYLHFSTYLAVFLAFFHQLSNGEDFVADRPARLAWYTLYLGVAALLLWNRFLTPLRRALRHRLKVAEVHPEAPGVVSVYLTGKRLEELGAQPGQFFRWRFLAPGQWWTANPFSLSAPAGPHELRITVKEAGGHSRAVARLRPGTRVWAEGPYGAFTAARRSSAKVLLLGGGVGITPLRPLFETLPGEVTLVYFARRAEDLALRNELEDIAAARGAQVHYALGEGAGNSLPLTADALCDLIPDLASHDVYLCGPPGMTEAAKSALRGAGVPRRRIHHESFAF
ncbi:ferric reductase-like transmembrane domain-containing protein [Streptomyces decoyicus]|uniref:Ferric reductase-like transmembrane domain-containing protein n=1 Tax=Streptomyces decoyicus TaxID=249567 RepID=A0ABZ1FSS3_9ACTN|nr:ferric reductase-like transmembrane domain-containing protein [Streptomyces decoyicus]WSB73527.1 ferric reductase-like transmembrane domain-containing protein [Streptomyces decoyicus]